MDIVAFSYCHEFNRNTRSDTLFLSEMFKNLTFRQKLSGGTCITVEFLTERKCHYTISLIKIKLNIGIVQFVIYSFLDIQNL